MRILTITLLLLPVCLCTLVTGYPTRRHSSTFPPCCVQLTSADISSDITGDIYEKQTAKGACMEAVIFRSNQGKVCADPEAEWVKELIADMTAGKL